jgi:hypothetical protein
LWPWPSLPGPGRVIRVIGFRYRSSCA